MTRHFGVIPVDRQQILRQVITADAKEINLFTTLVDDEHHRRHFEHDAERDLLFERNMLGAQLLFGFGEFFFYP
ncbi:hypothetical protein D3C87_2028880 [compost metagenome]